MFPCRFVNKYATAPTFQHPRQKHWDAIDQVLRIDLPT